LYEPLFHIEMASWEQLMMLSALDLAVQSDLQNGQKLMFSTGLIKNVFSGVNFKALVNVTQLL
jgi:hypothetical protein